MLFLNYSGRTVRSSYFVLAPPIIIIEFYPLVSIIIIAFPVEVSYLTIHFKSTPLSDIYFYNWFFSASFPTCPKKIEEPESRAAATA